MKKIYLSLALCLLTLTNLQSQIEFWGTTSRGGAHNSFGGTIFKTDADGSNYSVQHSLTMSFGSQPKGTLLQVSNGKMYGMTTQGSIENEISGVIFEYDSATNEYIILHNFFDSDTYIGYSPYGDLIEASNGNFYGMARGVGDYDPSILFEYNISTNTFTNLVDFSDIVGEKPYGSLLQATNGKLYGLTSEGGANYWGVLFEYDLTTNTYTKKVDFNATGNGGVRPKGSLVQATNGKLYGMASESGANNNGVIFEYDIATNTYTKKIDFDATNDGSTPQYGSLIQATDGKFYGMSKYGGINSKGVIFEYDNVTNTITKRHEFDSDNGEYPYGSLIQMTNGKLYGMTFSGGTEDKGVLFEFDPVSSTFVNKYNFNSVFGNYPYGSLLLADDGKLYGMTSEGGQGHNGVIFSYDTTTSTVTKKWDFYKKEMGDVFSGSMLLASNGLFYGMTQGGGENGSGVFYEYNATMDIYTVKASFEKDITGNSPLGSLIQANNGKLYGVTTYGGASNLGVLFEYDINSNTLSKKIDFDGTTKGSKPSGSLFKASDGVLYGLTREGGSSNYGTLYGYDPILDVFTKHIDFDGLSKGKWPYNCSLIEKENGYLYAVTTSGGMGGNRGVLFEFHAASATYLKLMDFDSTTGQSPQCTLVYNSGNDKLYGTTSSGGVNSDGVLFEYDLGTSTYTKKFDFDETNSGKDPKGPLLLSSNGKIYGTTNKGAATYSTGVLYEYDIATDTYVLKYDFDMGSGGREPFGGVIEVNTSSLGVDNASMESQINIYPNPTNSMVNINFGNLQMASIRVLNITGQLIYEKKNIENEIFKFQFESPAGIYFIEIISNQGKQIVKLIRE
jgi:uncharacterized repeat protein (TIGR03803 family)